MVPGRSTRDGCRVDTHAHAPKLAALDEPVDRRGAHAKMSGDLAGGEKPLREWCDGVKGRAALCLICAKTGHNRTPYL